MYEPEGAVIKGLRDALDEIRQLVEDTERGMYTLVELRQKVREIVQWA